MTAELPSWLAGGNPEQFARDARWHARRAEYDTWSIALQERYLNQQPSLVRMTRVADAGNIDGSSTFAALGRLPPHHVHLSDLAQRIAVDYLARPPEKVGLTEVMARFGAATSSCPDAQLPDVARAALRILLDDVDVLERRSSVELIHVDPALAFRMNGARLLAQLQQPAAARTLEAAARSGQLPQISPMAAGRGLASALTFGFDAYLAPLLLSVSPYVWAIPCARAGAVVLYSLGTAIRGREGQYSELLQMLMPRLGAKVPPVRSPLQPQELAAATGWYVNRLDGLLSTASDPARHTNGDGRYEPSAHFHALVSLEQVFRTVQSVGAADRDDFASRVMGLSALDTLKGLGLPRAEHLYLLARAKRVLAKLEQLVPSDAAAVLLPRAREAVHGLRAVQDGFLLTRHGDNVVLPDDQGIDREVPLAAAAAQYLRIIRNADHHTFDGNSGSRRRNALVLGHDGTIPKAVSDLPWLYLLGLLADPSQLNAR